MIDLLILVISIAVVDAVNPATVIPALYLASTARPVRAVLGFGAGFLVVNVAGGIVLLLLGRVVADAIPRPRPVLLHWGEIAAGAACLIAAVLIRRWRARVDAAVARMERDAHRVAPFAGVTIAAIELPTSFPYFIAIAAVSSSTQPTGVQIGLLVLFQAIFLAPLAAIAIACRFAGASAPGALERLRAVVRRYAAPALVALVAVAGLALIATGLAGLATA